MKKLLVLILVLCLAFGGVIGCAASGGETPPPAEESEAPVPAEETEPADTETEAETLAVSGFDYDALRDALAADETVLTIDGEDIVWQDYLYMFYYQTSQIQSYFDTMAMYYGLEMNWSDAMDESGTTYAEYAVSATEDSLRQFTAIRRFGEENEIQLTQENLDAIAQQLSSDMEAVCTEGGGEEEFNEKLKEIYMSRAMYDEMNRVNQLYQQAYVQLYGENGELYDEDAALSYLEDGGYISANHILFMTVDPATYEALDEEQIAEKQARAEEVAAELAAISDTEELLARFAELKEELDEDSGKTAYPDGYTFTTGEMVEEFENACLALGEYEVSAPVESSYGFHVILRLPLDADRLMEYNSDGTASSARMIAANADYSARLQAVFDRMSVERTSSLQSLDLMNYLA